jgi:ABC-type glycerol-3-phosphate transport system substrate-binding protein
MRKHPTIRKTLLLVVLLCLMAASNVSNGNVFGIESGPKGLPANQMKLSDTLYSQVLARWIKEGHGVVRDSTIALRAVDYSGKSQGVTVSQEGMAGKVDIVQIEEGGWAVYDVKAAEEGLYNLRLDYLPLQQSSIPIQISIEIDGKSPFSEANNIRLERIWKDQKAPAKDGRGNEIRPPQVSVKQWMDLPLYDATYSSGEPLQWFLSRGKHTVSIKADFQPIALSGLSFTSPQSLKAYEQVSAMYPVGAKGADPDWYTIIEAEQIKAKSEPAIQMQASRDDLASPESDGKITFNSMGGTQWIQGGQKAEWKFEVPADGRYEIHLKYFQGYYKEISTFRQVRIDGEVPFGEMTAYPFPYTRNWQAEALLNKSDTPYQFYLTKGAHTLSMTATHAPLTPVVESLQALLSGVQDINHKIRLITGVRGTDYLDKNRDWNLTAYIPDIKERLASMSGSLQQDLAYLQKLYGNRVNGASAIRSAIDKLNKLAIDPNELPYKPEELSSIQESLSSYSIDLTKQPLMLDQIYVSAAGAKLPAIAPSGWKIFKNTIKTFFLTFSPNYFDYGRQDKDADITVWVNRGRDYVTQMQQLVDEMFTPQTGIKVNVNIMPNPQLLILSHSSGREPDVALGLDQVTPVDFAIRNALLNLNQFKDYPQVVKQFHPGSLVPFHYDKGDYALPETILFNVLFYRTDILKELHLDVPQSWKDVYDMLPTLQQNGLDFFTPPMNYVPFFYQNKASFYTKDGLKSGLDTPKAFDAFKQWTDLFNIYGLPRDVPNFYMHFRNGDMPIGISDFNTYLQLLVAAPEISDSWSIAPIPGIKNENGVIERWGGGALQSGVIFKSTKHPDDSWAFLKWWTSTDVQTRFGNNMEMFNGIQFRWNTANMEAFQHLPWPSKHLTEIMKQYAWFKEMPNVPGGYFTPRYLNFAWNRTVLGNMNFRESLDQSVFEINRELARKQQEFGFVDENGKTIRKLDIPNITKPMEVGTNDQ